MILFLCNFRGFLFLCLHFSNYPPDLTRSSFREKIHCGGADINQRLEFLDFIFSERNVNFRAEAVMHCNVKRSRANGA